MIAANMIRTKNKRPRLRRRRLVMYARRLPDREDWLAKAMVVGSPSRDRVFRQIPVERESAIQCVEVEKRGPNPVEKPGFREFSGITGPHQRVLWRPGATSFFGRSIDDRVRPRRDVKRRVGSPGDDGPGLLTLFVHAGCDQPGIGWQTFCMQISNLPDPVGMDFDES